MESAETLKRTLTRQVVRSADLVGLPLHGSFRNSQINGCSIVVIEAGESSEGDILEPIVL